MDDFLPASFRGYGIFVIEAALALAALLISLNAPRFGDRFFRAISEKLGRFARRPVLSLFAIAIAPLILRVLFLGFAIPAPMIHDEFSNLLAGDTFAHGRLANPPHQLWPYFESMHILQLPNYASMYPPAWGVFLAIGQRLTGQPWFGVALATGLFCASLLWMLRGWFPPGWALLGASIAVMRIGVFSYWMNSYWGGSAAAIGGALAAGALARLWKKPGAAHGVIMAIGIAILANSRPYEGALFSIPIVIALFLRRSSRSMRVLIPFTAVLIAAAAATCFYNWRVTGNALQLPQLLDRQQYAIYGLTVFESPRAVPVYANDAMRDFYTVSEARYQITPTSFLDQVRIFFNRETILYYFFLGPLFLIVMLLGWRALTSKKLAVLGISFLFVTAGFSILIWPIQPHYYAPAACVIYAYLVQAMRVLRHARWRGGTFGVLLVRLIPVICAVLLVIRAAASPLGISLATWPQIWFNSTVEDFERAAMLARLNALPEKSLVIVRYDAGHAPEHEWVYNEADIDHAKVVWARELKSGNQQLLDYFKDRRVYLVEPDHDPATLRSYP